MQPIFNFIISTTQRYNNKVDVEGKELIVNTEITERDYQFVNRIGRVMCTPIANQTPIRDGDEVIVHHNVFRRWYDQHERERNSSSFIDDNSFAVFHDQIFAYKRKHDWVALPGYVFVAPVENHDPWSLELEMPLQGRLVYSSEGVEAEVGDTVGFTPNSEYEFNIDGQKLYRILSNQITWTIKKNERKSLNLQRSL